MACPPGGRFFASSLIVTPCSSGWSVAVPALCPWAFFNSTTFSLPSPTATGDSEQTRTASAMDSRYGFFMAKIIVPQGSAWQILSGDASPSCECSRMWSWSPSLASNRSIESIVARPEVLTIGNTHRYAEHADPYLNSRIAKPFFGAENERGVRNSAGIHEGASFEGDKSVLMNDLVSLPVPQQVVAT